MTAPRFFFIVLATVLGLAACGSDDSVDAGAGGLPGGSATDDGGSGDAASGGATRPWIGGDWTLQSITVDGAVVAIPPGAQITLAITGPDQIQGDAGCNSFGGTITTAFDEDRDGGSLSLGEIAITEMACDILDFESQYVNALMAATEWELAPPAGLVFRGDTVELIYGPGQPPADVPFENTPWRFDTIFAGDGVNRTASSTRGDKPPVTATFAGGQATLVSDDCGIVTLGAAYDGDSSEGAITFNGIDAALTACADPESNMVAALQGLADATGFGVYEGRLTFIGLPGETVSFVAADG